MNDEKPPSMKVADSDKPRKVKKTVKAKPEWIAKYKELMKGRADIIKKTTTVMTGLYSDMRKQSGAEKAFWVEVENELSFYDTMSFDEKKGTIVMYENPFEDQGGSTNNDLDSMLSSLIGYED